MLADRGVTRQFEFASGTREVVDVRTGDQAGQGRDYHHFSYLHDSQEAYAEALTHHAFALYRSAGHRPDQARALNAAD